MKIVIYLILVWPLLSQPVFATDKLDSCSSVEKCIQRINKVVALSKTQTGGVSEREVAIANKLSTFGDKAVDQLVPLLKNSDAGFVRIVAIALRESVSIDHKHLPKILEALNSNPKLGWLVPALARINSVEAAEETVKRYVGSYSAPHNQEAYAVRLTGERAIPFIIEAALCGISCGRSIHYQLGHVLGEMDEVSQAKAAQAIVNTLSRPELSVEVKNGLVYMVSFLAESALIVESDLRELRENNSGLSDGINDTLAAIKSPLAAVVLADRLVVEPTAMTLSKLAKMGHAGHAAGNVVIGLLEHNSIDIQIDAVDALGRIGYQQAVPHLIALLASQTNVNLNWVTVQSLGRLRQHSAKAALKNTKKSHWHPSIRQAARKAIKNLRTGKEYQSTPRYFEVPFDVKSCDEITLQQVAAEKTKKLYPSYAQKELNLLSYPSEIVAIGAADMSEQVAKDPQAIIKIHSDNMRVIRDPIEQVPDVALAVDGGWLAGSSRGEWGGELVFIADDEDAVLILNENIEDMYKLGDQYIVVAGLAHMGSNHGTLYQLTKVGKSWVYKPWRVLPGAPYSSWLVETGELLVNTVRGGSILVSEDGSMRMAECL